MTGRFLVSSDPALQRPATGLLVILARASLLAHLLVAGNDGYFRDELYYIADGRHLQAGYVDQPLLIGWLAALLRVVAGHSLVAIHIIPALAGALLAPDVVSMLPPATAARHYAPLQQVLADRLGWGSLTHTVERVYAALPPAEQAQACVLTSSYGGIRWWLPTGLVQSESGQQIVTVPAKGDKAYAPK